MTQTQNPGALDVVLIGAGIMSATLGTVLKELEPSLSITIFETLEDCGQESSQAWNNAGTGHAANCAGVASSNFCANHFVTGELFSGSAITNSFRPITIGQISRPTNLLHAHKACSAKEHGISNFP